MTPFLFDRSPLLFYLSALAVGFLCRLSALSSEELEDMLREAILKAMLAVDLSVKAAATDLCPKDATPAQILSREASLRRALAGEKSYHLPFVAMACRWPVKFWLALSPALFMVWGQKRVAEFKASIVDLTGQR